MSITYIIVILLSLVLTISIKSYTIEGYVQSPHFSDNFASPVEIFLNGNISSDDNRKTSMPEMKTYTDKKGYFFFQDISEGSYKLTISSVDFIFPTYSIDVSSTEGLQAYEIDTEHRLKSSTSLPLRIAPKGEFKYFEVKQPFDVNSFLRSPYGIMIAITVGLLFCMKSMPKMEDLQAADRVQRNN